MVEKESSKKYEWDALKAKYLESEHRDILEFFQAECRQFSGTKLGGHIREKTKGRKDEKKELFKRMLNEFEPSGKTLQKMRESLDKACDFMPEMIKAFIIGKIKEIKQYGHYPSIDDIAKFAKLIENYSGFKLGITDLNINFKSDGIEDPLREKLADIRKRAESRRDRKKSKQKGA